MLGHDSLLSTILIDDDRRWRVKIEKKVKERIQWCNSKVVKKKRVKVNKEKERIKNECNRKYKKKTFNHFYPLWHFRASSEVFGWR